MPDEEVGEHPPSSSVEVLRVEQPSRVDEVSVVQTSVARIAGVDIVNPQRASQVWHVSLELALERGEVFQVHRGRGNLNH